MESEPQRVALVMAASRGIGFACAQELLERGDAVAICGRDKDRVDAATRELNRSGRALGLVADVSRPEEIEEAVAETRLKLGPIDVLVTNAGGPPAGGFFDVTLEDWEWGYNLTVRSAVVAVSTTVPDMRARGRGRIVMIGSSSVQRPIPSLVLSNTYRPALLGLVKDLAVALAPDNITVNMVCPGRVDTDRVRELDSLRARQQGISEEEVRELSHKRIPMGRYGAPREFASVVGFFASLDASYITGQVILADGGMVVML